MNKEKLMDLLRNPRKHSSKKETSAAQAGQRRPSSKPMILFGIVMGLVLLSLLFIFSSQKRADNITASLDPAVLKGLVVDATFSPNAQPRYVAVNEGAERSVSVSGISGLPVISRFNYNALTPRNYEVIGAAPWALSINVTSNLEDPDLLRYLFDQPKTTEAFLKRADVAPLLADPAALARAAADQQKLNAFFNEEAVRQVLASPKLVEALAGSRLFSSLLVSPAVKYYRDRPAAAAKLIKSSPALSSLKKNPAVRKAVTENKYLKNIAPILLK